MLLGDGVEQRVFEVAEPPSFRCGHRQVASTVTDEVGKSRGPPRVVREMAEHFPDPPGKAE